MDSTRVLKIPIPQTIRTPTGKNRLLHRRYTMAIFFLKVENKRQNKLDFLLICEDKVVIRTTFARQHKINMRIKLCYKTTQNLDDNMEYKCG